MGVHDGDTITVYAGEGQPQIKVRLAGIDAPELKQAYGNAAKVALSDMVFGKPVELRNTSRDRYGRTVAAVIVDGATEVNPAMVRAGMAWHYKAYSKDAALAQAEQEARAAKRGLWQEGKPVAPWEFRKKPKKG
ncbi:MAG: micrococcal nuclease [Verrucomicrobiaceae bacterium]|nr:MAG: micrococcal nuclease [Verrucomicrobiaceae bacterium]